MMFVRIFAAALMLAPVATASLAQQPAAQAPAVAYPDTPAGRQMAAYQKATLAGPKALSDFLTANYKPGNVPTMMEEMAMLEERSGGLIPLSIDPRSTPTRIALKVRSANSGAEYLSILVVEDAEPHKITAMGMASGGYDVEAFFKRTP